MRSRIRTMMSMCLVFLIAFGNLATAFAAPDTTCPDDYSLMFEAAQTCDGAYSEAVAVCLADAFDNNGEDFIRNLAKYKSGDMTKVSQLLVYGESYRSLESFEVEIISLAESTQDAFQLAALKSIIDSIAQYMTTEYAEPEAKSVTDEYYNVFNPDTIKKLIDVNLVLMNPDEELFHVLGTAFRADTCLFIKTISGYSREIINYLAQGVANDCIRFNEKEYAVFGAERLTAEEFSLIKLFEEKINSRSIHALGFKSDYQRENSKGFARSAYVPIIDTITYTTSPLDVGTNVNLSVVFKETAHTTDVRTYYTRVYAVRDGVSWLKASKAIAIPAGSTSVSTTYTLSFSNVGEVYTRVEVYSSSFGSLLAQKLKTYPDIIHGKWSIAVSLSSDRSQFGSLTLYDASGTSLLNTICLGKSDSGNDMYTTNGDTPTGTYTGELGGPNGNTSSYGPYKYVQMTGVSGVIIESGRSGIWIHGGTTASPSLQTYPLRPTNGCVRITNDDQQNLENEITAMTSATGYHYAVGNITIVEVSN